MIAIKPRDGTITVGSAGATTQVCYARLSASHSTPGGTVTYLEARQGKTSGVSTGCAE